MHAMRPRPALCALKLLPVRSAAPHLPGALHEESLAGGAPVLEQLVRVAGRGLIRREPVAAQHVAQGPRPVVQRELLACRNVLSCQQAHRPVVGPQHNIPVSGAHTALQHRCEHTCIE